MLTCASTALPCRAVISASDSQSILKTSHMCCVPSTASALSDLECADSLHFCELAPRRSAFMALCTASAPFASFTSLAPSLPHLFAAGFRLLKVV